MESPQTPGPGWYQDPAGPTGQLRYFDGSQWTEHRAAAPTQTPYPTPIYGAPQAHVRTTPDGRPLASWGARLGAQLIDFLIIGVIAALVMLPILIPVLRDQINHDQQWLDTHPGQMNFDVFWAYRTHWQEMVAAGAIGLVVQAVYFMGFWRWKQATPGKMTVGLRIEYRDHTGPLTWGAIIQRWLVQYAVVLAYGFGSIFIIIDGLWPLWDAQCQALHEKWPRTNVVRTK